MAQIKLYAATPFTTATTFTPENNIVIDSIKNKYGLNLNFEESETISSGQAMSITSDLSLENLEIINGTRQEDGFVIVEYTEI
tara:strand:+ start:404 stop:652 length:249 start_codon:yes stop_codon:yes gene_type:complete